MGSSGGDNGDAANVTPTHARRLAANLLMSSGVPGRHAHTTASQLIVADLRGVHTHGLALLPLLVERLRLGDIVATAVPRVVEDAPSAAAVDGHHGLGQVNADFAMRLAVGKAKAGGVGAVTVRRSSHFGAAACYALMAAEAQCVGLVTTTGPPLLAPIGGVERRIGNNPLALASPGPGGDGDFPLVLDMAMSVVSGRRFRSAAAAGEPVSGNWALDSEGYPTREPDALDTGGSLRAVGDHKGLALAVLLEVLAGPLAGAGLSGRVRRLDESGHAGTGHFLMAIDIARFGRRDDFAAGLASLIDHIQQVPTRPDAGPALVPGQRAAVEQAHRKEAGIPYPPELLGRLAGLADQAGAPVPDRQPGRASKEGG